MKKNLRPTSLLKGKRRHGFRRRMKSKAGQKVLRRRRLKGRRQLIP